MRLYPETLGKGQTHRRSGCTRGRVSGSGSAVRSQPTTTARRRPVWRAALPLPPSSFNIRAQDDPGSKAFMIMRRSCLRASIGHCPPLSVVRAGAALAL